MNIRTADYVLSSTDFKKCPPPKFPEYAFIGRSNVGKSSLINMLTNVRGLAKTSGTPGKTQLINHFIINDEWYLVDLPGIGYAKKSKKESSGWSIMITDYLGLRPNLVCTFYLVDCRIEPQEIDLSFMAWLGENQVPFVIIFTKADKLKPLELSRKITTYKKRLLTEWEELPQIFVSSSVEKKAREDILNFIGETNKITLQQ